MNDELEQDELGYEQRICERIKVAREQEGLTQHQMAVALSVTDRAYQNYEKARVPWRKLRKIAKLTNTSEQWLRHGPPTDEPAAQGQLLRDVAAGVETLERSQEQVLLRLSDAQERLARIEAALSPPAEQLPDQRPG